MSDMSNSTKDNGEHLLRSRFMFYIFAFMVFYGTHFIYKAEGIAFDIMAGTMGAALVYIIVSSIKRRTMKTENVLSQLLSYRKSEYKISALINWKDLWIWMVPLMVLPFLLYINDFPIDLLVFGGSFLTVITVIYLTEAYSSLSHFKQMDSYMNWESIARNSGQVKE